jgi:hypothetical protein
MPMTCLTQWPSSWSRSLARSISSPPLCISALAWFNSAPSLSWTPLKQCAPPSRADCAGFSNATGGASRCAGVSGACGIAYGGL